MPALRFTALDPDLVDQTRSAAAADGRSVVQAADDERYPVRCCLRRVRGDEGVVLLSARPPSADSPYAAHGPVYLHAGSCDGYRADGELPEMLHGSTLSLRGYDRDHMITGTAVVAAGQLERAALELLSTPPTVYVFVHYAGPGCYACRVELAA
jgi:Protein of unknown function (DUF1203)